MSRSAGARDDASDIPTRILGEATRLFAARGFDGTSVQSIADAVGIRKPSLLYHFPSKDELRRAVLDSLLAHWNEVLPRLMLAATSGGSRFDSLTSEVIAFFTHDPDRARLLHREMLDRPDEMRVLIGGYLRPWIQILADYIRRGKDEGIIHEGVDPEAYVLHFINLVVSTVSVHDVLGILVEVDDGQSRLVVELKRMARSSLFKSRPTD